MSSSSGKAFQSGSPLAGTQGREPFRQGAEAGRQASQPSSEQLGFLQRWVEVRKGRPPRVALEKLGGSSKGPGEGVEETASGVAVRRLRMRSSAIAAGFPMCDEPG